MIAEQFVGDLRQRGPVVGNSETVQVHDTLACEACDVTILVLEAQTTAVRPTCCGRTMRTVRPARCSTPTPHGVAAGTSAGCCYVDERRGLVVRCTQSGSGVISCDNEPMKPLPKLVGRPRTCLCVRCGADGARSAPPRCLTASRSYATADNDACLGSRRESSGGGAVRPTDGTGLTPGVQGGGTTRSTPSFGIFRWKYPRRGRQLRALAERLVQAEDPLLPADRGLDDPVPPGRRGRRLVARLVERRLRVDLVQ
jgi:hypothetical protein